MIAPVSTLKILRLGEPDSPVRTAYTLKKIENVKKDENEYQDRGHIIAALETYSTIITLQ